MINQFRWDFLWMLIWALAGISTLYLSVICLVAGHPWWDYTTSFLLAIFDAWQVYDHYQTIRKTKYVGE